MATVREVCGLGAASPAGTVTGPHNTNARAGSPMLSDYRDNWQIEYEEHPVRGLRLMPLRLCQRG